MIIEIIILKIKNNILNNNIIIENKLKYCLIFNKTYKIIQYIHIINTNILQIDVSKKQYDYCAKTHIIKKT